MLSSPKLQTYDARTPADSPDAIVPSWIVNFASSETTVSLRLGTTKALSRFVRKIRAVRGVIENVRIMAWIVRGRRASRGVACSEEFGLQPKVEDNEF